jgi:hypothetical protein
MTLTAGSPSPGHVVGKEVPMTLLAYAFPIQPGKTSAWRKWADELNGPRQREFAASRERVGVRERTFLQQTSQGDLVIVTLEGEDPADAFGRMMTSTDPFTAWFLEQVKEFHGMDVTQMEQAAAPVLVLDSEAIPVAAR